MGVKVSDAVFDAGLNHIKNNATQMILVDAEPADRAAALAAALVTFTVTSGDFTLANGDVSGRKVTVAGKSGGTAGATGTHNHTAIISGADLLLVTTADTPKSINNGDTVNTNAFDYELRDPTVA